MSFLNFLIIRKGICSLLVFVLIANLAFFAVLMAPHEANAQFVIEWPAGSILQLQNNVLKTQSNVLQAKIAALEVADTQKNWLFQIWEQFKKNDGVVAELVSSLLLVMMHQVLAKITNDIVAWINGGGKGDRKSTRLNSSHGYISYAVFC